MKLLLVEDNPGDVRLFNLMLLGKVHPSNWFIVNLWAKL